LQNIEPILHVFEDKDRIKTFDVTRGSATSTSSEYQQTTLILMRDQIERITAIPKVTVTPKQNSVNPTATIRIQPLQ